MDIMAKYERLLAILRERKRIAVAFSGGVDSTFLLYAAKQALGDQVTAFTAVSVFFPRREKTRRPILSGSRGSIRWTGTSRRSGRKGVAENPKNRCYLCKRALFGRLQKMAQERGIDTVAEGSNLDDLGDYRPGLRAIEELGILSPLRDAGLTKGEIRELSRRMGLLTWDKPSFACLASRFVYGETITEEKLHMVDAAESLLLELGFGQFRVRIHGRMARIEVPEQQLDLMLQPKVRKRVACQLHALGFSYVSLDLDGYRTGSMNLLM